jgi:tetratricopeptide (TPR) repeat protein
MRADRNAAKHVLRSLDHPGTLAENPLLSGMAHLTHEERRAAVLRALDRLSPSAAQGAEADRKRRKHAIIVRCDVYSDSQEAVAAQLGLSIRQFFRERSEALEEFVDALRAMRTAPAPLQPSISTDRFAMRERLIQKLRGCGEHQRVWSEASSFAFELAMHEGAIEFWTVAAEAARYMGDLPKSINAIEHARRVASECEPQRRVAADILIAIPEIALDWTSGRYVDASDRLERVMERCGHGRTLFGLDATLFGIMLTYGISIEIERGRWQQANTLLRHLDETASRSDSRHTSPSLRRHAGRVALRGQRDRSRAIIELREALAAAQRFDNLAAEASAAVDLGVALTDSSRSEAGEYIDYGLAVARKVLGRNEFAMLALGALPAVLTGSGVESARAILDELAASQGLAARAEMAMELARVALALHNGRYRSVIERAEPLAETLERAGLHVAAEEAAYMGAIAYVKAGRTPYARRLLRERDIGRIAPLVQPCSWLQVFGSNLAVARL